MLDPFISAQDLTDYLKTDVSADPMTPIALDSACWIVRDYLGRKMNALEDEVVKVDGSGTDAILLPDWPIAEITSIVVDGEELLEEENGSTNWEAGSSGIVYRRDGLTWSRGKENVEVTYSTEWDVDIPASVRLVALMIAKRVFGSAGTDGLKRSETIGNYSYTLADATSLTGGINDDERRVLNPHAAQHGVA